MTEYITLPILQALSTEAESTWTTDDSFKNNNKSSREIEFPSQHSQPLWNLDSEEREGYFFSVFY